MVETMVAQMAKAEGVTESLKSTDPLRWGAGLRRRPLPKAEAPTELRVSGGHLAKRSNDRGCGSPVATFAAGKSNDRGGSRDPAAETREPRTAAETGWMNNFKNAAEEIILREVVYA